MAMPLPPGDPARLGPFRVTGRPAEAAAGIVYAGEDAAGRRVRVAVLTRGAASDPPVRARFRSAILAAQGLAAAQPDGPAPWVAVWEEDAPVAEALLAAALVPAGSGGPARTCRSVGARGNAIESGPGGPSVRAGERPGFQPYWAGSREPALLLSPVRAGAAVPGPLSGSVVALAVLAGLLSVLLAVLLACGPSVRMPVSPPSQVWTPPPQPASPVSPSPAPGRSVQPEPSGSGGGTGAA